MTRWAVGQRGAALVAGTGLAPLLAAPTGVVWAHKGALRWLDEFGTLAGAHTVPRVIWTSKRAE